MTRKKHMPEQIIGILLLFLDDLLILMTALR